MCTVSLKETHKTKKSWFQLSKIENNKIAPQVAVLVVLNCLWDYRKSKTPYIVTLGVVHKIGVCTNLLYQTSMIISTVKRE